MEYVKVLQNEFFPDSTITLALFKNVANAKEIRQCVMSGEFEASLLKPSMIVNYFQVLVAANRAVHLNRIKKMLTKNVHSEILFSLSPSKNISDSFRKFGLADTDKCVFVAIVDDQDGKTLQTVIDKVQGQLAPFEELQTFTDLTNVKKIYKITDTELSVCSLLDAIVSRISSKEIVTV